MKDKLIVLAANTPPNDIAKILQGELDSGGSVLSSFSVGKSIFLTIRYGDDVREILQVVKDLREFMYYPQPVDVVFDAATIGRFRGKLLTLIASGGVSLPVDDPQQGVKAEG